MINLFLRKEHKIKHFVNLFNFFMNFKKNVDLKTFNAVSKRPTKLFSTKSTNFLNSIKQAFVLKDPKKNHLTVNLKDCLVVENKRALMSSNSSNGMTGTKPFYTSYSKLSEVKLITLGLASPERMKQWAEKTLPNGKIIGKVINANTLHHKTFKPQKGGLFCERIFGPLKDFSCSCGKLNNVTKYKSELKNSLIKMNSNELDPNDPTSRISLRKFCPDCDVEYTWSVIRRYQLGYIELVSPVTHVWYIKGNPSYLSILLDMKKRHLEYVTYCSETLTLENSLKKNLGLEFGVTPSEIFSSWKKLMDSQNESTKKLSLNNVLGEESSNSLTPKIQAKPPIHTFFENSTLENQKSLNINLSQNATVTKKSLKRIEEIQKRKIAKPIKKSHWLNVYFSLFSTKHFEHFIQENLIFNSSSVLPKFLLQHKENMNYGHYVKFFSLYYKWSILNKNPRFSKNLQQNSSSIFSNSANLKINLKSSPIPFYILLNSEFVLTQRNESFSFENVLKEIYKKILISSIEKKRKILFKFMSSNSQGSHTLLKHSSELNKVLSLLTHETTSLKNKQNFEEMTSKSFFNQFSKGVSQKKLLSQIFQILCNFKKDQPQLIHSFKKIQSQNKNSIHASFLPISGTSISMFNSNVIQDLISKDLIDEFINKNSFVRDFIENSAEKIAKPLIKNQISSIQNFPSEKKDSAVTQIQFKGKPFEMNALKTHEILKKIIVLIGKQKKSLNLEKTQEIIQAQPNHDQSSDVTQMDPSYQYETNSIKVDVSKLFLISKKINIHALKSMDAKNSSFSLISNELSDVESSFFVDLNPSLTNPGHSSFTFLKDVIKPKDLNLTQIHRKFIDMKKRNHEKIVMSYFAKLNENSQKKGLISNIYALSHRQRWEMERDWNYFRLYFIPKTNPSDAPIPIYNHRVISSEISMFSTSNVFQKNISREKNQSQKNSNLKRTSGFNRPNLGPAFYSGPGIVSQMLNEFTFSELKKMDSQNRILLYHLNKHVFKLKNQLNRLGFQKRNIGVNSSNFFFETSSFSSNPMDSQISFTKLPNSKSSRLLKKELKESYKKRDLLIRRTKLVRKLFRKDSNPQSMILTVLPVLPPDLRPIVKIGGQIAASDLNRLYQRVIYRNDRLKKFLNDPATNNSYEMKYAQRLLQEAVDNLISNGKSGVTPEKDSRGRLLKSLSDILKGKQGRFRQYLLGKRVDYSGRSVIVVGPTLKLHECGIPKEMALELYLPFLLKTVLNQNLARTVVGAKTLIKKNPSLAWELLREIMQSCPVLLNRAPTLHRLGIQAFQPKLIEGRAILLHPLVCSAFNADFDGDQMAVHIPITIEARAEAWKLMLSRNNLLSPATGEPLAIPSQDMVLGCYYLTTNCNEKNIKHQKGSGFYFKTFSDVVKSFENKQLDLHSIIWVQWNDWVENGTDHEEPLEIRLDLYGNYKEIYSKSQKQYDSKNRLVTQYVATTPGRVLFNQMIQTCKR